MLLSLLAIFIQPMLHNYDGFACRQHYMHSYSYVFRISIQHLLSRIFAISGVWPTTASTIKEEEKTLLKCSSFWRFFFSLLRMLCLCKPDSLIIHPIHPLFTCIHQQYAYKSVICHFTIWMMSIFVYF